MATIIERTGGRYEIQDVEFGKVYKWCPGRIVVECPCGRTPALTSSLTTCQCGADHAAVVGGELDVKRPGEEPPHPWRSLHYFEDTGLPF